MIGHPKLSKNTIKIATQVKKQQIFPANVSRVFTLKDLPYLIGVSLDGFYLVDADNIASPSLFFPQKNTDCNRFSIVALPNGIIASGSYDHTTKVSKLKLWDLKRNESNLIHADRWQAGAGYTYSGHAVKLAASPDGQYIAAMGYPTGSIASDGKTVGELTEYVRILDTKKQESKMVEMNFTPKQGEKLHLPHKVSSMLFTNDNELVLVSPKGVEIYQIDFNKKEWLARKEIMLEDKKVQQLSVSADGKKWLTVSKLPDAKNVFQDVEMTLWNVDKKHQTTMIKKFPTKYGQISSFHDGKFYCGNLDAKEDKIFTVDPETGSVNTLGALDFGSHHQWHELPCGRVELQSNAETIVITEPTISTLPVIKTKPEMTVGVKSNYDSKLTVFTSSKSVLAEEPRKNPSNELSKAKCVMI